MYRVCPGCSPGKNACVDFFLAADTAGGRAGRDREGKSALSMHSHPFDHSSSISGLDVECNSRRRARGTEGEQQWKRVGAEGEDKVPRVEAAERHGRDKGGLGREKEER